MSFAVSRCRMEHFAEGFCAAFECFEDCSAGTIKDA